VCDKRQFNSYDGPQFRKVRDGSLNPTEAAKARWVDGIVRRAWAAPDITGGGDSFAHGKAALRFASVRYDYRGMFGRVHVFKTRAWQSLGDDRDLWQEELEKGGP
jgi:hypothetical protein